MTTMPETETRIELRCPVGFRALLGKVIASPEQQRVHVNSDNLLELVCRDCTRNARQSNRRIAHVFHRYNVLGELVESVATER
jgi:hypothetical protein